MTKTIAWLVCCITKVLPTTTSLAYEMHPTTLALVRKRIPIPNPRIRTPPTPQAYAVTVGPATVVVNPASVVVTVTYTVVASGSTGTIVIPASGVVDEEDELVLLAIVSVALDGVPVTTVGKSGEPGP